jgi:hypothetical protein
MMRFNIPTLWQTWLRVATTAMHGLILLCFFSATWWWRPRWLLAEWVPAALRNRLLMPIDSDAFQAVYFTRFALTFFIALILVLWVLTWFRGLGDIALDGRIWWILCLGILVAWIRLSIVWAGRYPGLTSQEIGLWKAVARSLSAQWLLTFGFVLVIIANGPPLRQIVLVLTAGLIFQGSIAIAQSALQHEVGIAWVDDHLLKIGIQLFEFRLDPQQSGTSVVLSDGVRYLRAYGLTAHPNLLGAALVMGLLASSWLWLKAETRRTAAWVTALGSWALFATFSRAALGGLVVGMAIVIAWWWFCHHWQREAVLSWLVLLMLVGLVFLAIAQPLISVRAGSGNEGRTSVEEMSIASRRIFIEQAQAMIREHSWKGVGIGNFPWVSQKMLLSDPRHLDLRGNNVHNIYYLALAETGIVGTGLVAGTLLMAAWLVWQQFRHHQLSPEAIGLLGGVGAWLAIGWFEFFPWSLFPHQVLFWGALAAVLAQPSKSDTSS